jgi:hypothetical protein
MEIQDLSIIHLHQEDGSERPFSKSRRISKEDLAEGKNP